LAAKKHKENKELRWENLEHLNNKGRQLDPGSATDRGDPQHSERFRSEAGLQRDHSKQQLAQRVRRQASVQRRSFVN